MQSMAVRSARRACRLLKADEGLPRGVAGGASLAAIVDSLREAGDALRRQLKQYLDEASQAKSEVSELKREIFKLQQQKK